MPRNRHPRRTTKCCIQSLCADTLSAMGTRSRNQTHIELKQIVGVAMAQVRTLLSRGPSQTWSLRSRRAIHSNEARCCHATNTNIQQRQNSEVRDQTNSNTFKATVRNQTKSNRATFEQRTENQHNARQPCLPQLCFMAVRKYILTYNYYRTQRPYSINSSNGSIM